MEYVVRARRFFIPLSMIAFIGFLCSNPHNLSAIVIDSIIGSSEDLSDTERSSLPVAASRGDRGTDARDLDSVSTSQKTRLENLPAITIGVTRFLSQDVDEAGRFRYLSVELQRYLIRHSALIQNGQFIFDTLADQAILSASSFYGELDSVAQSNLLEAVNSFLNADLIVYGGLSIDEGDGTVDASFQLFHVSSKRLLPRVRVIFRLDSIITGFNAIFSSIIRDAQSLYDEDTLGSGGKESQRILGFNAGFSLSAYKQFSQIIDEIYQANYPKALQLLDFLETEGQNLDQVYGEMAYCYEQLGDFSKMFESYWRRFQALQNAASSVESKSTNVSSTIPRDSESARALETAQTPFISIPTLLPLGEKVALFRRLAASFLLDANPKDAMALLEASYRIADEELQDTYLLSEIRYDIAKAYAFRGFFSKSTESLEKLIEDAHTHGHHYLLGKALLLQASNALASEEIEAVPSILNQLTPLLRQLKDAPLSADAALLRTRLSIYNSQEDEDNLWENIQSLVDVAERVGDRTVLFSAYLEMGKLLINAGDRTDGTEWLWKARNVAQKASSPTMLSEASLLLAQEDGHIVNCDAKNVDFQADLHMASTQSTLVKNFSALYNAALIAEVEGNYVLVERYYNAAQLLAKSTDNHELEFRAAKNLARNYLLSGDYDRAFLQSQGLLSSAQESNDYSTIAYAYALIGEIFERRSQMQPALTAFGAALGIIKDRGLRHDSLPILLKAKEAYKKAGQNPDAAALDVEFEEVLRDFGIDGEGVAKN